MKISRLQLRQGMKPPWYYGLAYCSVCTHHNICYPILFNWRVRFSRDLAFFLKMPNRGYYEKLEQKIFDTGYEKGYEAGRSISPSEVRKAAYKMLEEELEKRGGRIC